MKYRRIIKQIKSGLESGEIYIRGKRMADPKKITEDYKKTKTLVKVVCEDIKKFDNYVLQAAYFGKKDELKKFGEWLDAIRVVLAEKYKELGLEEEE